MVAVTGSTTSGTTASTVSTVSPPDHVPVKVEVTALNDFDDYTKNRVDDFTEKVRSDLSRAIPINIKRLHNTKAVRGNVSLQVTYYDMCDVMYSDRSSCSYLFTISLHGTNNISSVIIHHSCRLRYLLPRPFFPVKYTTGNLFNFLLKILYNVLPFLDNNSCA